MKFEDLKDFLENRMRMSHIYQPLFIKSLIEAGGSATIRQLAHKFLSQDESQILYYEKRIKEMPLKVLRNHGVVSSKGDFVSLNIKKLSYEQKVQIKMICEQKLQEFLLKKGLGTWDYRMLDTDPIPDVLRYRVLMESGGRCALCGATKRERPLDVDHIIPRSKGGKNVYENLQILCSKCNRSKGNKDKTDFRDDILPESDPECPFCYESVKTRIVKQLDSIFAIEDRYPVTKGHLLIIPKRHTPDYFTLSKLEKDSIEDILQILQRQILVKDPSVTGFNIGINNGESAGQTIFHAHIHLIPRRDGDTDNPRGGVRGVIPGKRSY
jgi:diadenosine tetraphosphate (Ap4A) HIT family hydrolase